MDVLVVIESLGVGGAELHLCRVAPRLVSEGVDVRVFAMHGLGPPANSMRAAGVDVISGLPADDTGSPRPAASRELWRMGSAFVKLAWLIRKHRPRIVHYFLPAAYLLGYPAALIGGARVHVMSRRSLNNYQARGWWVARTERRYHRGMAAVVGNSRAVLAQLIEEGVSPSRLHLIYNGVDGPSLVDRVDRDAARARLGIGGDEIVLTMIANLIEYKGHADLIDALARLSDLGHWRLLLVGRDQGQWESCATQAAHRGIAHRVTWLGARNDIGEILAASDIGILCSHQEGFSNAIIEAMSAGLPMVVTDVGGNAEAVRDGITGRVVPARNPVAVAESLRALITDPALRRSMGDAGLRRVREHFSLDACVAGYLRLYAGFFDGGA